MCVCVKLKQDFMLHSLSEQVNSLSSTGIDCNVRVEAVPVRAIYKMHGPYVCTVLCVCLQCLCMCMWLGGGLMQIIS